MLIVNLLDRDRGDIKPRLAEMAESTDPWSAAKGKKLLDLVRHLESLGPEPVACGSIMVDELWLMASNPPASQSIQIEVDWPDHGPVQDGMPLMHYRVRTKKPDHSPLSSEIRTHWNEEVERLIFETFGWSR